jgi:predicted nicotinamide N-methyase
MRLHGKTVLELGCGLALPALAASQSGAAVTATDWSPDAVALARLNARRNGLEVETAVLDWTQPRDIARRWDVVLAADVLYERRNGELLLALLGRVLADRGEAVIADPGRPHARRFFAAVERSWRVETRSDTFWPAVNLHRLTRPGPRRRLPTAP